MNALDRTSVRFGTHRIRTQRPIREIELPRRGRGVGNIRVRQHGFRLGRGRPPVMETLQAAALPIEGMPNASMPEMWVNKWLTENSIPFQAQASEFGGRLFAGGAVVDFIAYYGTIPIALPVQGNYWHGVKFPETQARDNAQADQLRQKGYEVVWLWEETLREAILGNYLDNVMWDALAGIQR